MADGVRMRRTRGLVSALFLVLLGAWTGLAPFLAPYFGFGLAPDRPWVYTVGRLYFAVLPGVVILLAGLIIASARSRSLAVLSALFAALAGVWLILGTSVKAVLPAATAAALGGPGPVIGSTPARIALTQIVLFTGAGVLVVFFSALAAGRVSIAAHKDHLRYTAQLARGPYQPVREQAPALTGQYPGLPPDIAASADDHDPDQQDTGDDQFGAVYERFPDEQVILATRDETEPSEAAAAPEAATAPAEFTATFRAAKPPSASSEPAPSEGEPPDM